LLRQLLLPSPRLPFEFNRGRRRLIVAFTRPISHHTLRKSISSPMIIARLVLPPRLFCWPVNHIDSSGVGGGKKACVLQSIALQITAVGNGREVKLE
jgi:hypothetical protein